MGRLRDLRVAMAGACLLVGCDRAEKGAEAPRDLSLLYRMIELDAVHRGMEPYLRNRDQLEQLADAADGAALIADSELLRTWPERPGFARDTERWETFRSVLSSAATDAAAAARAGDLDALHEAYSRMDGSCIACHKRYLETY